MKKYFLTILLCPIAVLNTECESLEINEGHLYPEEREARISSEMIRKILDERANEATNCFKEDKTIEDI